MPRWCHSSIIGEGLGPNGCCLIQVSFKNQPAREKKEEDVKICKNAKNTELKRLQSDSIGGIGNLIDW